MYKYNVLVIIIIWVCLLLQILVDPDVVLWSCQYTQWLFRTRTTNAVLWYFSFLSLYGTTDLLLLWLNCNLRKDCAKYLQRCFNFIVSVNYGIPWLYDSQLSSAYCWNELFPVTVYSKFISCPNLKPRHVASQVTKYSMLMLIYNILAHAQMHFGSKKMTVSCKQ